jgi:sec-independent protein translocase protein TatA
MQTTPLLAAFGIGGTELLIIAGIALLFFGGSKLPSLAKGLGQSVKEFKKATKEAQDEDEDAPKSANAKKTEAKTSQS